MPPAALEAEAILLGRIRLLLCFAKKQGLCRDTTSKMKIRPEGYAKNDRQLFSRAFGQLGNITPLLHIHDHERHIVALRLAIRERRHFLQNTSDDLLRCGTTARAQ